MPRTHFFYGEPSPPRPNRPLAVGVTTIVRHPSDNRVLLERRSDNGQWATLGGGVDPGEMPEETVAREVREETGLVVTGMQLVGVLADPSTVVAYPDGNVVRQLCLTYLVDVAAPAEPQPSDEALELRYFEIDEALRTLDLVSPARFQLERLAAGERRFLG